MRVMTAGLVLLMLAGVAHAEAGGVGGTAGGNGSHNNDNNNSVTGDNNCAGGGCGVDGAYHQKGTGWPGQGDGVGTR